MSLGIDHFCWLIQWLVLYSDGVSWPGGGILVGGGEHMASDTQPSKFSDCWSASRFLRGMILALFLAFLVYVVATQELSQTQSDLSYNSLHYDVRIEQNGDLRISQILDVHLKPKGNGPWRRLCQRYTIKSGNLTGISDVSVKNLTDHTAYKELTTDSDDKTIDPSGHYSQDGWEHEMQDTWYLAKVDGAGLLRQYHSSTKDGQGESVGGEPADPCGAKKECKVEIGWNMPETPSADHEVFQVDMTFHGVTTAYDDVGTFQWEPIGEENTTPVDSVTGVIHMPGGTAAANPRAWLHFEGNGGADIDKDGTIRFFARKVRPAQYLDLVTTFDVSSTKGVARVRQGSAEKRITDSEQSQARSWRIKKLLYAIRLLLAVILVPLLAICAIGYELWSAFRSYRDTDYYGGPIDCKDLSDLSPAAAGTICNTVLDKQSEASDLFAATILSLAKKKAISISSHDSVEDGQQGSSPSLHEGTTSKRVRSLRITTRPLGQRRMEAMGLAKSEQAVVNILRAAIPVDGDAPNTCDMDQLNEALTNHPDSLKLIGQYTQAVNSELTDSHITDIRLSHYLLGFVMLVMAAAIIFIDFPNGSFYVRLYLALALIAVASFSMSYGASEVLTDFGRETAGKVVGYRQHLLHPIDIGDETKVNLKLFDSYLVYATAFGISEEVVHQIAAECPQLTDATWLASKSEKSLLRLTFDASGNVNNNIPDIYPTQTSASGWSSLVDGNHNIAVSSVNDLGSEVSDAFTTFGNAISEVSSPGVSSDGFSGGSDGGSGGGSFGGSSGGSGGGSFGGS